MSRELSIEERYSWLCATLEQLAAIPSLTDEDLGYAVFEALESDVRSGLHDTNLDPLVVAARISRPMKQELLQIRDAFLPLLDAAHAAPSPSENIRRDGEWVELSERSSRLLSSLGSQ